MFYFSRKMEKKEGIFAFDGLIERTDSTNAATYIEHSNTTKKCTKQKYFPAIFSFFDLILDKNHNFLNVYLVVIMIQYYIFEDIHWVRLIHVISNVWAMEGGGCYSNGNNFFVFLYF